MHGYGSAVSRMCYCKTVSDPGRQHAFDLECKSQGIEHRLCPPRHPQTNGMVERFNGRISELVQQNAIQKCGGVLWRIRHHATAAIASDTAFWALTG